MRGESFRPHWLLRNGHLQTLMGVYAPGRSGRRGCGSAIESTSNAVALADGDFLVYQDDCPLTWRPGDRIVLLLHGLGGSHASPYLTRLGRLFNHQDVRTFRLDWRGCGAGAALARYPYHSGRSEDLAATIQHLRLCCPDSPLSVIGFSLGGNVVLKLLGEASARKEVIAGVDRVIAVSPPIDLALTVQSLGSGWARMYDRYFCTACTRDVRDRHRQRPELVLPPGWHARRPKTLYEFDETFTAPVCGFTSALDYYRKCSSHQFLAAIDLPVLVIAAEDDPLIPFSQFQTADYSATTTVLTPRHGGHLGFFAFQGVNWLDERILEWTLAPVPCSPW
jgi:predicted alpha/beta-fold hydrolase